MNNLFVYGTLMNKEVQQALTGKVFKASPATLEGFIVSKLRDRASPGLVKQSVSVANGLVLHDVDETSFQTIKNWENNDYELISVVPSGGIFGTCYTFLWKAVSERMQWDYIEFVKNHLQWYLEVDIPTFLKKNYT